MLIIRAALLFFLLFSVGLHAQTTPYTSPNCSEAFIFSGIRERDRIFTDYANLYNRNNAMNFGVALLGGAVLANTKMDGNFQHWHDKHMHSSFSNDLSKGAKFFGEGGIWIPVMATSALSYRFLQEKKGSHDTPCVLGDFTDRTMRGYFVGAPTLLVSQFALGGCRPSEGKSYWQPFHHKQCGGIGGHGVSGHSFMGAVPFITAAHMTDRPFMKGMFYALSTLPAWSRVHDDRHYLSQVMLGWYLAYLSVRAVSQTESSCTLPRGITLFPVCTDDQVGAGFYYQF